MFVVTFAYRADAPFNRDYYLESHIPMAASKFGPLGMLRGEVQDVVATPDGTPPPYQFVTQLYFETREALQAALDQVGAEVLADVPNYFAGTVEVFIGELLAS